MKPLEAMNIIKALNVKDIELARYFHDLDETISVRSWQVWLSNGQYHKKPSNAASKENKLRADKKYEMFKENIVEFLEEYLKEINIYTGKYEISVKERV